MLRGLIDLGFSEVCATPHQKAGQFLPSAQEIEAAFAKANEIVSENDLPVSLHLAAENMWDSVFHQRFTEDTIPSYDQGPAILIEIPPNEIPLNMVDRVFELRRKGRLPVLAHPERYTELWDNAELLAQVAAQCAMVIDLGAVAGFHGRKQAKFARRWILDGTAHAVASDAHSPEDIRAAAAGIAWIRKKGGDTQVKKLLSENPRKIIKGLHPAEC